MRTFYVILILIQLLRASSDTLNFLAARCIWYIAYLGKVKHTKKCTRQRTSSFNPGMPRPESSAPSAQIYIREL
ncbi:hypothetical protein C2E23DRAFT_821526 [Lenzites betulinus]|nr:hypothetical protein C2E23DRAFT_821526 [Lenzites betulinus]